jgi:hypothetical protein
MPGYAYPVGATGGSSAVEAGSLKSINALVEDDATPTTALFTASTKTRVNSVLATNAYGSILPVKLYAYRDSSEETFLVTESRIFKSKYMVQRLISGDTRVDDKKEPQVDRYKAATEFVLQAGDSLMATCPIEDVITLTVTVSEGVS